MILQFSHEEPEDFGLSSVIGMFSNAVLGNTWDVPATHFKTMKRLSKESFIATVDTSTAISKDLQYKSRYQFALEESPPLISNPGGTAKVARNNVWPVLQRQALYSLLLTGKGMREPHWHPETTEMGYVAKGKGRMSILCPSGKVDTYKMEAGDITVFQKPTLIILKIYSRLNFIFLFFLIKRCHKTLDLQEVSNLFPMKYSLE